MQYALQGQTRRLPRAGRVAPTYEVKTKNPEPVAVRDWKEKVQSQAHTGIERTRVAAAAAA